MSGFWKTWLVWWCAGVALFGLILAGGAFPATGRPVELLLEFLNGTAYLEMSPPLRFSLAVMGCVSLGWSVTLYAAIEAAHKLAERGQSTWMLITIGALSWFVFDTILSVATGFGLNAIPNIGLIAAYLLPVLRSGVLRRVDLE